MAGRSVRGAAAGVGSCPHLLSAVTHDGQVVLAQRQIPDKGSEISEISELAVLVIELDLAGKVVTLDALCRLRHKASYEDVLVMPMCCPEPQLAAASPDRWSAYSQVFEEGHDGVGGTVTAGGATERRGSRECLFFEGEVGVDVDLGGGDALVAQP